jgi:hypothetical protein
MSYVPFVFYLIFGVLVFIGVTLRHILMALRNINETLKKKEI